MCFEGRRARRRVAEGRSFLLAVFKTSYSPDEYDELNTRTPVERSNCSERRSQKNEYNELNAQAPWERPNRSERRILSGRSERLRRFERYGPSGGLQSFKSWQSFRAVFKTSYSPDEYDELNACPRAPAARRLKGDLLATRPPFGSESFGTWSGNKKASHSQGCCISWWTMRVSVRRRSSSAAACPSVAAARPPQPAAAAIAWMRAPRPRSPS